MERWGGGGQDAKHGEGLHQKAYFCAKIGLQRGFSGLSALQVGKYLSVGVIRAQEGFPRIPANAPKRSRNTPETLPKRSKVFPKCSEAFAKRSQNIPKVFPKRSEDTPKMLKEGQK